MESNNIISTSKFAPIKNVSYTQTALFFSNNNGLYFRLRYEENNGWRLQTSKTNSFNDMGACQLLSSFLYEKKCVSLAKLFVSINGGKIIVDAPDKTKAILSLENLFSLTFCAPNGDAITEIIDVCESDNNTIIKGALKEDEAIYGGGERFDTVNKRGQAIKLLTCDGWNNSSTTYLVIPLFLTSRGGGFFFNKNEPSSIDLGKTTLNQWIFTQADSDIDCYFTPTGNILDPLKNYTNLSGNAQMPKPWMQGMHICRYAPDFTFFKRDLKIESLDDFEVKNELFVKNEEDYICINSLSEDEIKQTNLFYTKNENGDFVRKYSRNDKGEILACTKKGNPSGNSIKTIVNNYIKMGAKPKAVSLEGKGWHRSFIDTDESRASKEDLKNALLWLKEKDIRSLLYIRVGDVNRLNVGFKEEYLVHADVEITDKDGNKTLFENTTDLPWIRGTGANPDVTLANGSIKRCNFLDITNPEAIEWYFCKIWGELIELGVDGVKIDFCEIMPENNKQMGSTKTIYKWKNPNLIPSGSEHHAYPVYFITLFHQKMLKLKQEKGLDGGFMLFSRGGGIGSQRNPYLWAGDQSRAYEKLDDQLFAVINSGLSGLPFMSFDMGGYAYARSNYHSTSKEKESEIFLRALEFASFTTQMQTHGDVRHAYEMTDKAQGLYCAYTELHDNLIPYIQKYSKIACECGIPPVRHLILNYPNDKKVYDIDNEFLLGDALLIAPILTDNTFERTVYLPKGSWIELLTDKVIEGGKWITASANLYQIPVYLNKDSVDEQNLIKIFQDKPWQQIKNAK